MLLNTCNFIQRTEQVQIKLDISTIEDDVSGTISVVCEGE